MAFRRVHNAIFGDLKLPWKNNNKQLISWLDGAKQLFVIVFSTHRVELPDWLFVQLIWKMIIYTECSTDWPLNKKGKACYSYNKGRPHIVSSKFECCQGYQIGFLIVQKVIKCQKISSDFRCVWPLNASLVFFFFMGHLVF